VSDLRALLPYLRRYRGRIVLGLIAITISNVFSVAIPRYIGGVFDSLTHAAGSVPPTPSYLLQQALIILGLSIGSGLFLFLTRQTIIVMSRLLERDLRDDFLRTVQRKPMSYFHRTPTGDVMALATNDINAVREFVGPAIMYSANTVTTFAFAITMMLMLNWKMTLLAMIPLPLVSYTVYYIGKRVHSLFTEVQAKFAELTSHAQEHLSGARVIRAYVREAYSVDVFAALSASYRQKNIRLTKIQALMMPTMIALIGLSQLIVLVVGGMEVAAGRATIGTITQFSAYIGQLIWPVIAIGWVTNLIQRGAASMKRLSAAMSRAPEPYTRPAGELPLEEAEEKIRGEIEFRNVSYRYGEDLPLVLEGISFHLRAGRTLAIIGTTGAGKSTLVDLVARVDAPTSGEILVDGRRIEEIPLEEMRAAIGMVTQESFLFSDTVAGNIRFGRREADMEEVVEAARIADVLENIESFPRGFETIVGERGITLSGGQKQRTSIARAVLRRPRVMILDDALSAVDTETEEHILSELRGVMQNRTTILIAHRISTVKDADEILVMHQGRIVERGTHEQLLEQKREYARVYERQLLEDQLATL